MLPNDALFLKNGHLTERIHEVVTAYTATPNRLRV